MLGQLDGKGPHAARARLDKDLLALFDLGLLDQRLPGRQRHQGKGRSFFHGDVLRLERQRGLFHRHKFSKRTDAKVVRPCVDLITHFELPHAGAHLGDHASHVVAQDEGQFVRQDELELSTADLRVQKIHTRSVDLDQDFVVAQLRGWQLGQSKIPFFAVAINDKCFHGFPYSWRIQVGERPTGDDQIVFI